MTANRVAGSAPRPSLLESAAPDGEAQRAAEQLGIGELLPWAGVAVVIQDLELARAQDLVQPLGGIPLGRARAADGDQVHVEGRERLRPRDAALVGELL